MRWYVLIKIKFLCPRSESHKKVKQNDNLCSLQDSGSIAVFNVTARDQKVGIRGLWGHLLLTVTLLVSEYYVYYQYKSGVYLQECLAAFTWGMKNLKGDAGGEREDEVY